MGAASNFDDILGQLRAAGLIVDEIIADGRVHRTLVEGERGKKGWYLIHEWSPSRGGTMLVGSCGVNRGNDHGTIKLELKKTDLTSDERDALRTRLREDRARADAARAAEAKRAAARASAAWRKCTEVGESDYLTRKAVPALGVRYSPSGALVIPMQDAAGQIHGLQIIRTRADADRDKRPEKEFWPAGLAKKGHYHLIGTPRKIVLIAEGYATGASLAAATQLPVAIAFDANNLQPVASDLHRRYRGTKILICADDDAFAKCPDKDCAARIVLADHPKTCPGCGKDHGRVNTGVSSASTAALAIDGAFIAPVFRDNAARNEKFLSRGIKDTDFNDLQHAEGLLAVRAQIEAILGEKGWLAAEARASTPPKEGGGNKGAPLRPIASIDELLARFSIVYGLKGAIFDHDERLLVADTDLRNICLNRYVYRAWMEDVSRSIVRQENVGFDPACTDKLITCNLWSGWPTTPKAGSCERILDLVYRMCSREADPAKMAQWLLKWIAYPIKHPGAKMRTTVVVHGPAGFGKNVLFENYLAHGIYRKYGHVINQDAIEDKFNDWASGKLFLVADEVISRDNTYHVKNKLKQFITGDTIRINPKNMAAYEERNHVNMVFLSNEARPVALDEDDRRHAVLYTPAAMPAEYYQALRDELNNDGAAAFHDYLITQVDLSDFDEHTKPPLTQAKLDLIERNWDVPVRFYYDLGDGAITDSFGIDSTPCLSEDLYRLFERWCNANGVKKTSHHLLRDQLERKGVQFKRERYHDEYNAVKQGTVAFLPVSAKAALAGMPSECPPGGDRRAWLGKCIARFANALGDEKKMSYAA